MRILGARLQETVWFSMACDAIGRADLPNPQNAPLRLRTASSMLPSEETTPLFELFLAFLVISGAISRQLVGHDPKKNPTISATMVLVFIVRSGY